MIEQIYNSFSIINMSLLWERVRDGFLEDLQNKDRLIRCTKEALQLVNEIQGEKGIGFLRAWLHREGEFPLLFEYIKHYRQHIPFGFIHEDGTPRLEATLAKTLLLRLKELSPYPLIEVNEFIRAMGHLFLLE